MAITVKHSKVSTIPDGDDPSVVRPSDWNADHVLTGTVPVPNGGTGATTLTGYVKGNGTSTMTASATIPNTDITGLGTMSTQDASNVNITGGSISGATVSGYIPTSAEGVPNGVATLDSGGQIPLSQIPPLGDLNYQGTWNASTNTPTLTSSVGTKGYYYVVSVAGTTNLNGITDWQVNDWAVFNGSIWQKIDNTDAVTSVNGQTGTVVITLSGLGAGSIATQNANNVAITGGSIDGTPIGATTASTGAFTTATASTSLTTPIVKATNSSGLSLQNSAGTTQLSVGAGGGNNIALNVATNINPANSQVDISPTGTGTVRINPATASSMDNVVIGATTPKAITGTTVTATTFNGSGSGLTSIPNSALVNSAITINGTSTSLGGSINVGTVTSVSGTAPIASTGGATPTISISQASGTTNGYLSSTDWNTFNNKGSGSVTSVTGTAPVSVATGTTTPVISLASGYGDTQNPYASKTANYVLAAPNGVAGAPTFRALVSADIPSLSYVSSVSATAPLTSTGGLTPTLAMPAATGSVNGYLTSTDWTTFNNKQPAGAYLTTVTADAPLTGSGTSGSHLSIPAATGSVNGYLTSTDWTTFNNKAPSVTYTTNYIPFGQGTTSLNQSANLQWDGSTMRVGSTALLGGTTNPIVGITGGSTNYIQGYIYNSTNGASSSADIVAYPNNGTDAHGWVDIGITSQTYADATYTVTGPNEAYLFGSAPSGAGKTGNLVYATDSTGSANAHQFYVGGFTQAKGAWKAQIDSSGLSATQLNATNGIVVNSRTISASFAIPSGSSAMSAGPITIASGVTVTVPSGGKWVVL